ncbi:MAG: 2-C-methyl-D-erythritol 4-phosphate cytidylyltransferase [Candidatus Cloacimonetes bacterium]|nr:2-C-methyl-D-erythritol 4-phosphate cytidylyltransferase [Candidatus Cloacimonadota bacterium]
MKCGLVLLLGGSSKRFGSEMPKQFLNLLGRPVWTHSLMRFAGAVSGLQIVFVVSSVFRDSVISYVNQNYPDLSYRFSEPGAERQDSVLSGLNACDEDTDFVLIHDGARPNPSQSLILRLLKRCMETKNGVIPGLSVTDSVKEVDECGMIQNSLNRQVLRVVQTPQVFVYQRILSAYRAHVGDLSGTDDAWFALKGGNQVEVIEGEPGNFKLTMSEDLARMEKLMGVCRKTEVEE